MRLMPVTDAMFLWGESRETPMHIGGINLYTLPDGVDEPSGCTSSSRCSASRRASGGRSARC